MVNKDQGHTLNEKKKQTTNSVAIYDVSSISREMNSNNYVINNYVCLNNLIVGLERVELHDQAQIQHF